ncbi:MAG: hypothetical protein E7376_04890 [Clostridiales bacterium]|nr:hypothetical protein [Clostridiales bacterium]
MQISKITIRTKCDFPGCKNLALNSIGTMQDINKKLDFCDDCINAIYACVAKSIIPKGIDSPFKKQKKLR